MVDEEKRKLRDLIFRMLNANEIPAETISHIKPEGRSLSLSSAASRYRPNRNTCIWGDGYGMALDGISLSLGSVDHPKAKSRQSRKGDGAL